MSLIRIDENISLLKINPETMGLPLVQNTLPRLLVGIIDFSGSMGQSAKKCHQGLGKMAIKLGYTHVWVITFDSTVSSQIYSASDLISSKKESTGTTRISGTVAAVEKIIKSVENHLIQMIVISDGIVDADDKPVFMKKVSELSEKLQTSNTIHVIGCRLKTSSFGTADTQALSGYFNIHNYPGITPDVLEWLDVYQIDTYLSQVTKTFERCTTVSSYKLESSAMNLRSKPWSALSASVPLLLGDNIVLVDTSNGVLPEVKLNGNIIGELKQVVLENEDELASFISELEFKVRNWHVMGGQDGNIQATVSFVEKLQGYFNAVNLQNGDMSKTLNFDLRARTKTLFKIVQRQERSRLQSIRELGNNAKVSTLNAAQLADFLRKGDSSVKSVRRLAGRTTITDVESEIVTGLQLLRDSDYSVGETELPTSFYGLYDDTEVVGTVKDTFNELSQLDPNNVLQIIGQVGVAYMAKIGNYPDPWAYSVQKVFPRTFLAQNDLWQVLAGGGTLSPPGHHAPDIITGIDVLMTPGAEELYDLFRKTVFPRLQASVSMRRMIAPVPWDIIALKTAVTMKLVEQIFGGDRVQNCEYPLTIGSLETLVLEIKNIRHLDQQVQGTFGDLPQNIVRVQGSDLGAYLTGRQDISSLNKICCFLLARYDQLPENFDFANLARVMLSLDNYHYVRATQLETDIRERVVDVLLGIDLSRKTPVGDDFSGPVQPVKHYSEYSRETLFARVKEYQVNHWKTTSIIILTKILRWVGQDPEAIRRMITGWSLDETGIQQVYGIEGSTEYFFAANAVQAIKCKELSDRVDTEKMVMKLPDIVTPVDRDGYLTTLVSNRYQEFFEKEMKEKVAREHAIMMAQSIKKMVSTVDMNEFKQTLNAYIPQRDLPGFKELFQKLVADSVDAPGLRAHKLWILVTGTDIGTHEIVWNNGNTMRGGFHLLQKFFSESDWNALIQLCKAHNFHVYRVSNIPNRHGHCNTNPSWYGYGYSNLTEMYRDTSLQAVKQSYVAYVEAKLKN